jgi:hypothetical protein
MYYCCYNFWLDIINCTLFKIKPILNINLLIFYRETSSVTVFREEGTVRTLLGMLDKANFLKFLLLRY